MAVSAEAGRAKQVVFCAPSLGRLADDRGVKEAFRYYGTNFRISLVPTLPMATRPTSSVGYITDAGEVLR